MDFVGGEFIESHPTSRKTMQIHVIHECMDCLGMEDNFRYLSFLVINP